MTVGAYLDALSRASVLDADELKSINTSIGTIQQRLEMFFEGEVTRHFRFGSSSRGTILPRWLDERSDIDYMVVFAEIDAQPQTYLDRLRRFADAYYHSSDKKQSHPSIVLELNHIKFDLVPATVNWIGSYQIPAAGGGWQSTNPGDFSNQINQADSQHNNLLKPAIRIAKIWNASRGYVYESFAFEKWIASKGFLFCSTLRDYVFYVFDQLDPLSDRTRWQREEVARARNLIARIRNAENNNNPTNAVQLAMDLFPAKG